MTKHEYQLISYIVDNSLILPDDAEKIKKDILNLCTVEGMEEISLEERYKSLLNEYNAYKLDGNDYWKGVKYALNVLNGERTIEVE